MKNSYKILKGPGYFRPDLSKFIKIEDGDTEVL